MKVVIEFSKSLKNKNPSCFFDSFSPESKEDETLKKIGEEILRKYEKVVISRKSESYRGNIMRRMESDALKYENSRIALVTCFGIKEEKYRTLLRLGGGEYDSEKLRKLGEDAIIEIAKAVFGYGEIKGVC